MFILPYDLKALKAAYQKEENYCLSPFIAVKTDTSPGKEKPGGGLVLSICYRWSEEGLLVFGDYAAIHTPYLLCPKLLHQPFLFPHHFVLFTELSQELLS